MIGYRCGGRQIGKTYKLIEWVEEGYDQGSNGWSRIILTTSEQEAERVRRILKGRNRDKNVDGWVASAENWNKSPARLHGTAIAVDNLDMILRHMLGDVEMFTMSEGLLRF